MKKFCIIFFLTLLVSSSCLAQGDPNSLHRSQRALTSVIVHDIFSPPVSSRIYAYAHIAAYEILVQQDTTYKSLQKQIKTFPAIEVAPTSVSYDAAAVYAFLQTGKRFVFSEKILTDSMQSIMAKFKKRLPKKTYLTSVQYGEKVAATIIAWAEQDGYNRTRKMRRYDLLKSEGKWTPTPPVYLSAVEPHWTLIRPFIIDSASQFKPIAPPQFSREAQSEFYRMAMHVYTKTKDLTEEERRIANFWDCNPFAVNVHGHINFATKKLSPGGHWLSIAGIAAKKENAGIVKTSAAYTLTAITLFDAFISCWNEKYRSNLIRPESYINAYIDENWKPMLQTPPFPEYTSGHSVISTASAVVLSKMFGDKFSFDDTSEIEYGLPVRKFNSFQEACDEAAVSRLFGGIHYLPAIEHGQTQGKKLGMLITERLSLVSDSNSSGQ